MWRCRINPGAAGGPRAGGARRRARAPSRSVRVIDSGSARGRCVVAGHRVTRAGADDNLSISSSIFFQLEAEGRQGEAEGRQREAERHTHTADFNHLCECIYLEMIDN